MTNDKNDVLGLLIAERVRLDQAITILQPQIERAEALQRLTARVWYEDPMRRGVPSFL
jgi:hypothetical protein